MNGILWIATMVCNPSKLLRVQDRLNRKCRVIKERRNDSIDAEAWGKFVEEGR